MVEVTRRRRRGLQVPRVTKKTGMHMACGWQTRCWRTRCWPWRVRVRVRARVRARVKAKVEVKARVKARVRTRAISHGHGEKGIRFEVAKETRLRFMPDYLWNMS